MSERRFKQALILLGFAMLAAIIFVFSSVGSSKAEKEELAKIMQQANAELLERRSNTPQYRLEQARIAIDGQFPGECGAEAKFTYLSNGEISVRCSYDERFVATMVGPKALAMRCHGLNFVPAACSTP